MRYALLCLLFSVSLSAQSTAKLDSDLMTALSDRNVSVAALSGKITDDILALADKNALPSRQTTLDFSIELTKGLAQPVLMPKVVNQPPIQTVTGAILERCSRVRGLPPRASMPPS